MGYGDDLMLIGEARAAHKADPQRRQVAARRGNGQRWSPLFQGLSYMASLEQGAADRAALGAFKATDGRQSRLIWLDENAGRRYRASETRERRVWTGIGPATRPELRGEIRFTPAELHFAERANAEGHIVVEPNIKPNATPNKDWGWENWQALVDMAPRLPWLQLGPATARRLNGVRFVETPDFRHAAAVLGHATAAVLPEGGLHHAAAAVNTAAVVIFGGYIGPAQTGYPEHVNLTGADEPCGWRIPCLHCKAAMAAISPGRVLVALDGLLRPRAARDVAAGAPWPFQHHRNLAGER
jgi:hypothetical protein